MYKQFKRLKELGLKGRNKGIPFTLKRFAKVIPNIQKARLYVIGALSGAGKTKVVNELFVYNAYDETLLNPNLKLRIIYWSLELPATHIIAGLIVRWLQLNHNILVDTDHVLSLGDKKLSPFVNELIESKECQDYVEGFSKVVDIRDEKLTYISASKQIDSIKDEQGTTHFKPILINGETHKQFDYYEENDPDQYTLFIIDHVSLVSRTKGQNKKDAIDALAEIFIKARNRYSFTFIATQQLNRAANSTDRTKLDQILPKDSDFKDSNGIIEACDVAIGILNPYREGMDSFMKYKVKPRGSDPKKHGLKGRLLVLHVIKNRYGQAFLTFPLFFYGETGTIQHLPIDAMSIDYDKVKESFKHFTDEQ